MTDEQTNENDTKGTEVNSIPPTNNETTNVSMDNNKSISPLDRAEAANKEKAALLDREEKLQERKERLYAEEKVGGRAMAGQTPTEHVETPEEKAEKFAKGEMNIL